MIDGKNIFDQTAKNNLRTYNNTRKIAIGQGDHYATEYLLDFLYFKKCYRLIAKDLSK